MRSKPSAIQRHMISHGASFSESAALTSTPGSRTARFTARPRSRAARGAWRVAPRWPAASPRTRRASGHPPPGGGAPPSRRTPPGCPSVEALRQVGSALRPRRATHPRSGLLSRLAAHLIEQLATDLGPELFGHIRLLTFLLSHVRQASQQASPYPPGVASGV